MTNAKIRSIVSGTTKDFKMEGYLSVRDRKSQLSPPLPIPTLADDKAVLTSIMGQTRTFVISFLILDRSDDYTDKTGSPGAGPYTIQEQKEWIRDTIFTTSGAHYFIDENGTSVKGRIQDLEFVQQGDDPYSDSAVITFARGIPF